MKAPVGAQVSKVADDQKHEPRTNPGLMVLRLISCLAPVVKALSKNATRKLRHWA